MSDLSIAALAEVNPPLRKAVRDTDLVSFVSMSDVRESGGIKSSRRVLFSSVKAGFTRFQNGDVLFAKITPCMENGKGALAIGLEGGVGCGSTEFHVLRAKPGNSEAYVYQLLQWGVVRQKAETFMSGSAGQQRVPSDFFARHRVFAPASPVQRKIAAILTSLDTAIEKTEALIEKHQQIKAGLMHDLFTRGVLPNGQLRPPREQAPEQFQETSLGPIPGKWNISALGSLVNSDITYGIVQAGPHVDGGIPYVRTGDMSGDFLDRSQMLCTSRRIANAYKRSEVRSGDIVMAIRATVGKVLPVPPELDGANLTQGTAKVSAKDGIDRTFLLWALRQRRFQESVLAAIKGTTFAEITLAALRKLPLAVPSCTNEQALIALRLQRCEGMIQIERQQRDKLQQQKLGLMQDLLTGKVPVKIADSEAVPA